jgi:hypothetical protein
VLIILLMMAPLRSVMAVPCDMASMDDSSNNAVMMAHDMSSMLSVDSEYSEVNDYNCCDDISISCTGGCDLVINASLLMQETFYAPVYTNSFKSLASSSKTLFRELTPPLRPPANLYS